MPRESAAPGEPGGMPVAIAERVREIGARIEPAGTAEIYAPLHLSAADAGLRIVRDLTYGTHERHVLDVFAPADGARAMLPVLVFVHGGGFSRGAKCLPDLPFYDNVMCWAASHGLIGVNINYRLAPSGMWPSGIEDVSAVVAWIAANIERHGGDSSRVIFWGHSAGAAHVADYIASRTSSGQSCELAGAVLT